MSKTIDERVVSMQFDNRNFESNVKTTMSTLDRLKASLNLSGASKGLEGINAAANKCNLSPMGNAVDGIKVKFSALQVAAVTALTNITNSAVNAGKRMIDSLTIAPIREGFQEYEMTLNAVQTTMAGTGKTAAEVQEQLKKLDEYADKTVYSTADMLNNLPKFTNAGVDLEKATTAMIGIANATALAGGDASKASIAFYNLGQAIGTGYLTRMDYNSINNAGIATMEWKNQMVEAAIAAGTLKKVGEDLYKAGNKTFTLQQLFIDGLQKQWATTDVMMKVFGDYGDETTEIGKKSYAAAQDIKTFTMMMDSLKATAGTGWKDTWQLIFGDLDQAKALWTGLSNFISNIITKIADFRNGILEVALSSPIAKVIEKINTVTEPIKKVSDALEDYEKIADRIIGGEFGNGKTRWDKLTEMGYDWAKAQNIVNERLGCSVRHTEQLADAQDRQTESQATTLEQLTKMNRAQLKALGFTKTEIEAIYELGAMSEKTGISIEELSKDLDQLSGRNLLINSFKNLAKAIGEVLTTAKIAWQEIFPPKTIEERGAKLYDMIAALHKFTKSLGGLVDENGKLTETGDKLARTFKGIFAVLDVITTVAGGGLKIAFKVLTEVLSYFDMDILDLTASIGDALVNFRDWVDSVFDVGAAVAFVIPYIQKAIEVAKSWFNAIKSSDVIQGLVSGLTSGAIAVWNAAVNLAKSIWEGFCNFLEIHSPSKKMAEAGVYVIEGLIDGLVTLIPKLISTVKGIASNILDFIKNIDIGSVVAVAISIALLKVVSSITTTIASLATPLQAMGSMFTNVGEGVKKYLTGLGASFKADAWEKRGKAILFFALAIAVLAGSVYLLSTIEPAKLWNAVAAVTVLATVVGILAIVIGKLGAANGIEGVASGIKFSGIAMALIGLSVVVIAMAYAVRKMGELANENPEQIKQGFLGLLGVIGAIIIVMASFGTLVKGKSAQNINKLGAMLIKLSVALLLLVLVTKLVGKLSAEEMLKGAIAMSAFVIFVNLLARTTRIADKQTNKLGGMLLKMSLALILLIGVAKLAGTLSEKEMRNGAIVMGAFIAFVGALAIATRLAGDNDISKLGSTLLAIAASMLIMMYVGKIASKMTPEQLLKGGAAVVALGGIIVGLIAATRLAGDKELKRVSRTLLMASVAIAILAGVVIILGLLSMKHLIKGAAAVYVLGTIIAGLILATANARDCANNLMKITIAIALMAAAVAALSFIDTKKLLTATGAMSILMGMFALMTVAAGASKGNLGAIISLTVVVALIAAVIYAVSRIPLENTVGSVAALAAMLITMTGVLAACTALGKVLQNPKIMLGLVVAVAALALIGLVVWEMGTVLSKISSSGLDSSAMGAVGAISAMLVAMTVVLAACTLLGTILKNPKVMLGLVVAVAALGLLGLVVWEVGEVLTKLNSAGLDRSAIGAVDAITAMLVAMTGVLAACSLLGVILQVPTVMLGLTVAVVALALLGLVVWEVGAIINKLHQSGLDSSAIGTVNVLSAMLIAMTAVLAALALIGLLTASAVGGVAALALLGLVAWEIGAIVKNLHENGLAKAMPAVIVLTIILTELTKLLIPLTIIGLLGPAAFVGIAALQSLALFVAELGIVMVAVGALLDLCPSLETWLSNGLNLVIRLAGGIGEIISAFGVGLTSGLPEIASNLTAFAESLGGTFISLMRDVDEDVLSGAGRLAAAIICLCAADFITAIASLFGVNLSDVAKQLNDFANNIGDFMTVMSDIDTDAAEGIGVLCSALTDLTKANLIDTITNLLPGDNNLSTFGENISAFATCIKDASVALKNITDEDVANIKRSAEAGEALATLNKAIPAQGGWAQTVMGSKELSAFGESIVAFGDCLVLYSSVVSGKNIDAKAIKTSAEAGQAIADLNGAIPAQGGWAQAIMGSKELSTFGESIVAFADCLVDYSAKVTGQALDKDAIIRSAEAADALATLNGKLPSQNGLWQAVVGEKNMGEFGVQLISFAKGLVDYANAASQIDETKIEAITNSGVAVDEIVKVVNKVPTSGGWGEAIFGSKDGQSFGAAAASLAKGITEYCRMAATITDDSITAISNTGSAIDALSAVMKKVPSTNNAEKTSAFVLAVSDMKTIGTKINSLSVSKYDYSGLTPLQDAVETAASIFDGINISSVSSHFVSLKTAVGDAVTTADTLKNLNGYTYGGVDRFKEALTSLSGADIDGIISEFSGRGDDVASAMNSLVSAMANGLNEGSIQITTAMNTIVNSAVDTIKIGVPTFGNVGKEFIEALAKAVRASGTKLATASKSAVSNAVTASRTGYNSMVSAGKYLGDGLVAGINSKKTAAYNAGYALGQAAVKGEKDGQKSRSPSRLTIQAGKWLGEGLVIGMNQMGNSVYNAGRSMGKNAIGSISDTISRISDVIESDMDTQPTIRPVLDLSDVQAGAGMIGSLLGGAQSIGAISNINSISTMMNRRSQNGGTNDVVSAIDKLRKDLGNVGNTSYNINGITYDSGSELNDAIRTIVRYAKIEGRV